MDPHNYVTKSLSGGMSCMIDDLHKILSENQTMSNMDSIDLTTKNNHYTVLLTFAGEGFYNQPHWDIILTVCILQSQVSI